jgi:hypothetical protein
MTLFRVRCAVCGFERVQNWPQRFDLRTVPRARDSTKPFPAVPTVWICDDHFHGLSQMKNLSSLPKMNQSTNLSVVERRG